jgi:N6-L-threonylcarbamoyladenine synthase
MRRFNNLTILAIETSCDETAIAILKSSGPQKPCFELLANVVASQIKIHRKYGGVYPTLAKREHQRNLVPVLEQSLSKAKLLKKSKCQNPPRTRVNSVRGKNFKQIPKSKYQTLKEILVREKTLFERLKIFFRNYQKPKIDVIAVTIGPGLEPCLWVGVNFAKALSFFWELPIVPINHMKAHILANWLPPLDQKAKILFPVVCLVVSGGHTQLVLMKNFDQYEIIGETRDDAAGECFDKTARTLGLSYPGGPAIAAEAAKFDIRNSKFEIRLPRPMIHSKNYDFSFSGLKTAVLYHFKKQSSKTKRSKKYIQAMAHEIQNAINDVLVKKTIKAAEDFGVKTIILAGGVAANEELREKLKTFSSESKINFLVPPRKFCTDNAAMIAVTAFFQQNEKKNWQDLKAEANLRIN